MGTIRPGAGDLAAVPVPWAQAVHPDEAIWGHYTVAYRESGCRSVGTTSRTPGREGPGQERGFCWPRPYPPSAGGMDRQRDVLVNQPRHRCALQVLHRQVRAVAVNASGNGLRQVRAAAT